MNNKEKIIIAPNILDPDALKKGRNIISRNEINQKVLEEGFEEAEVSIKKYKERILEQKKVIEELKENKDIHNKNYKSELEKKEILLQSLEGELRDEIVFKSKILKFLGIDILDKAKVSIFLEETEKEIAKFKEKLLNGTPASDYNPYEIKENQNN